MVHLLRTAAGLKELQDLQDIQTHFKTRDDDGRKVVVVTTRNMPKRVDELLAGGSLYWIVRASIQARQKIVDIRAFQDEDGERGCMILLDPVLVRVMPVPQRAVQGWRYLDVAKAPRDLGVFHAQDDAPPEDMADDLRKLGLY